MNLNSLIKGFFICIWNSSTKTQVYKTLKYIKLIVLNNKFGIWEKYDFTAFLRWKISRWKNPSFILVRKFGKYQDATKSKHILINAIIFQGKSANLSFLNILTTHSLQKVNFFSKKSPKYGYDDECKKYVFFWKIFFPNIICIWWIRTEQGWRIKHIAANKSRSAAATIFFTKKK